jgi:hypothetical protein
MRIRPPRACLSNVCNLARPSAIVCGGREQVHSAFRARQSRLPALHPRFRPRLDAVSLLVESVLRLVRLMDNGETTGSFLAFLVKPVYYMAIRDNPVPP